MEERAELQKYKGATFCVCLFCAVCSALVFMCACDAAEYACNVSVSVRLHVAELTHNPSAPS